MSRRDSGRWISAHPFRSARSHCGPHAPRAARGAAVAVGFALALVAVGCGSARPPAASTATGETRVGLPAGAVRSAARVRARLVAHGYTVSAIPARTARLPVDARALYVGGVDWTTPHAFDVYIYVFGSAANARAHTKSLQRSEGAYSNTDRVVRSGADLFVAALDNGGPEHCTISAGGAPVCPPLPRVPMGALAAFVSTAEGT
jgi:hypothetical protein